MPDKFLEAALTHPVGCDCPACPKGLGPRHPEAEDFDVSNPEHTDALFERYLEQWPELRTVFDRLKEMDRLKRLHARYSMPAPIISVPCRHPTTARNREGLDLCMDCGKAVVKSTPRSEAEQRMFDVYYPSNIDVQGLNPTLGFFEPDDDALNALEFAIVVRNTLGRGRSFSVDTGRLAPKGPPPHYGVPWQDRVARAHHDGVLSDSMVRARELFGVRVVPDEGVPEGSAYLIGFDPADPDAEPQVVALKNIDCDHEFADSRRCVKCGWSP